MSQCDTSEMSFPSPAYLECDASPTFSGCVLRVSSGGLTVTETEKKNLVKNRNTPIEFNSSQRYSNHNLGDGSIK